MAWTAPRTWVTGEVVTAANMNVHVRDNLNALSTAFLIPEHQSGEYYVTQGVTIETSSGPPVDRLYALPFHVPSTTTYDRIGMEIDGGATAGATRLGIYSDDGSGQPGALVLDAGTIDTSTVDQHLITISESLSGQAKYWLAYVTNVGGPTYVTYEGTGIYGLTGVALGGLTMALFRSFTYAALPNPWGTPTGELATTAGISLRAS